VYSPVEFVDAQWPVYPPPLASRAHTWSPAIAAPPEALVTVPAIWPPSTIAALMLECVAPAVTDTASASAKDDLSL
jgi:hypothetical protein